MIFDFFKSEITCYELNDLDKLMFGCLLQIVLNEQDLQRDL